MKKGLINYWIQATSLFGSVGAYMLIEKYEQKIKGATMKNNYLEMATQSKHWETRISPAKGYNDLLRKITCRINFAGARLLDVGCAEGREVFEFSKLGLEAEGLDLNEIFIAKARKSYSQLKFTQGDAESIPLKEGTFDIVFSIGTLFYTDIEKSIPELVRVLRIGGYGVISFDIEIKNLDKNIIFHEESVSHLEEILSSNNSNIIYLGSLEERIDEEPFRHHHCFYKIIFQKSRRQ